MNVTSLITVVYENKSNWKLGENKPNTNPIQTQSCPPLEGLSAVGGLQNEHKLTLNKGLQKKR
jgi:hypothetical protein